MHACIHIYVYKANNKIRKRQKIEKDEKDEKEREKCKINGGDENGSKIQHGWVNTSGSWLSEYIWIKHPF